MGVRIVQDNEAAALHSAGMRTQEIFTEVDSAALYALIRRYPLATLVTSGPQGMDANLLPLDLVIASPGPRLHGHFARQHPLHDRLQGGAEVLAVFQGPNAYISPRWYVNGQRSRRNAPSWNYVAIEARGTLRLVDDRAWLIEHLTSLTAGQEQERDEPWSLADADAGFIEETATRLIGFEIEVTGITGRRFLSQQRTEADRRSIIEHLEAEPSGMARDLAKLIRP